MYETFLSNGDRDPKKLPKIEQDVKIELNLAQFLELLVRLCTETTAHEEKIATSEALPMFISNYLNPIFNDSESVRDNFFVENEVY